MKNTKSFFISLIISATLIISASLFAYSVTSEGLLLYDSESHTLSVQGKVIKINSELVTFADDYFTKISAFYNSVSPKYINKPIKKSAAVLYTAAINSLKSTGGIITSSLMQNT